MSKTSLSSNAKKIGGGGMIAKPPKNPSAKPQASGEGLGIQGKTPSDGSRDSKRESKPALPNLLKGQSSHNSSKQMVGNDSKLSGKKDALESIPQGDGSTQHGTLVPQDEKDYPMAIPEEDEMVVQPGIEQAAKIVSKTMSKKSSSRVHETEVDRDLQASSQQHMYERESS